LSEKDAHEDLAWRGIIVTRLAAGSMQGSPRALRAVPYDWPGSYVLHGPRF